MPLPNEHSCRLADPDEFVRFRRNNSTSPHTIIGFRENGSSDLQSFRYPKSDWTAERARTHCADHDGSFEAASGDKETEPEEEKAVTKQEEDGPHPASHYLVVEDSEKPTTWHLRVRNRSGALDHGLMGSAWAALHAGFRGNKYGGPNKAEAIAKLRKLYASEGMTVPSEKGESALDELKFGLPIQVEEVKTLADGWEVAGYASTFNNIDFGNDVVLPGAFDRTLVSGHKVRFLHSHDPRMVLGVPKTLKPDSKGLFGRFKISQTRLGEDTRVLLQDKALDNFSIGYRTREYELDGEVRELKDVDLWEVSLVALPMNANAVVTDVKSYLVALGLETQPELSLSEQAAQLNSALSGFIASARTLINRIDRPLTHKKRQELEDLLELCSGMDAVRSELATVLETAPTTRLVDAKRIRLELESHRRKLAHILKEDPHEYDRRGSPL